ncbi:hypothetical protein EYC84_005764 [Monilinia fructicola]|uniref:Uncharacterized protein n=1 Tax=Monilinia fructicola TaxID=38448 RepID=A0A5M9K2A9_MONFR|nr:hypothetical protein EYC84_005764 [Monilinia fructicola]
MAGMERPEWNGRNGMARMEWPKWNGQNGMAEMEGPEWNGRNGMAGMEGSGMEVSKWLIPFEVAEMVDHLRNGRNG